MLSGFSMAQGALATTKCFHVQAGFRIAPQITDQPEMLPGHEKIIRTLPFALHDTLDNISFFCSHLPPVVSRTENNRDLSPHSVPRLKGADQGAQL